MRTGKSPREFFDAMKKKPALQAILDNIDDYTIDQLENVSGQPLWIRNILVELKNEDLTGIDDESRLAGIEAIADRMMNTDQPAPPVKYEIREWIGGDWFMSCGKTGSMSIEVKAGNCLYVIDCDHIIEKYIVGMDSTTGMLSKEQWLSLLHNSTYVGTMTKPEYSAFVSDRLGKKYVDRDEIAKAAGPNSYVDPAKSNQVFTITRHDVTK